MKSETNLAILNKAENTLRELKIREPELAQSLSDIRNNIEGINATFDFLKVRTPLRTLRYEGA